MIINCIQCGKEKKVFPHVIKKGGGKYCSYHCRNTYLWSKNDYKEHMKLVHKGYVPSNISNLIQRAKSEKGRKEMSERMKGKSFFQGKHHTEETKKKISLKSKGRRPPNYIEDRTKLKKDGDRRSSAYGEWRRQVWLRDKFTCKITNPNCKGRLEAHHILGYTAFPELRYDINNGITLCHAHHPRKRSEEKRLIPEFQALVSVSKKLICQEL